MSSNDGATWNNVDPGGWAYEGMAFANDTLGYLTGYYHNYITTNGGLNWSILNTPTIYSFQPDGASPTTFFDMSSTFASEDTQKV